MPKTLTKTVYKFEELPEKVQQKVLDRYREHEMGDSFWYENVVEDFKLNVLPEYGIGTEKDNDKKGEVGVYFDAGYSQRDHACFGSNNSIRMEEFCTKAEIKIPDILKPYLCHVSAYVKIRSGYTESSYLEFEFDWDGAWNDGFDEPHREWEEPEPQPAKYKLAADMTVDVNEEEVPERPESLQGQMEAVLEDLEKTMNEAVKDINHELLQSLYKEIEYLTSDEHLKDEVLADLWFDARGDDEDAPNEEKELETMEV